MKSKYVDLLERVVWTFLQSALAVWVASEADLFGPTTLKVAAVAGAIAAAKCLLAFQIGAPTTAATLPAGPDTDLGGDAGASAVEIAVVVCLILVVLLVAGVL